MFRCPAFCALALTLPAACLAAVVYSGPALACGATPCSELEDAQPSDSDDPVPLNTELRVLYFGTLVDNIGGPCDRALTHLKLVPRNGAAIDLEGTLFPDPSARQVWVVAQPPEPLLPDTSYTLQVEGLTGSCNCGEGAWVKASTFTTGLEPNAGAPEFSGLDRLSTGAPSTGFTGCGEASVVPVTLELGTPQARSGLRYDVYVDGVLRQRYASASSPGPAGQIETQCTTASGSGALLSGGSEVEVRAVDLAGQESAAHAPLKLSATCEAESGCALSPGMQSPGMHSRGRRALVSLSLALLAAVRRRAVRSAPRYAARRP